MAATRCVNDLLLPVRSSRIRRRRSSRVEKVVRMGERWAIVTLRFMWVSVAHFRLLSPSWPRRRNVASWSSIEDFLSVLCATLHGMAICMACDLEMLDSVGCTWRPSRIPNGRSKCHDCGAPPRTLHHPGCDGERCRCGQMLSCGSGCAVDECEREDGHDYIDGSCRWCNEPSGQLRVVGGS
jgi:hypothetical protein